MLRLDLTPTQRAAVEGLRRDPTLKPAERDRVELILLADAGWAVPRIARHLGYCAATVRRLFHHFRAAGPAALRHERPGPPPDTARRARVEAALRALLERERTWTTGQLAAALQDDGIRLSARQVRRYLGSLGARYRRTVRTLDHKQAPERVAAARQELAALKNALRPAR